MKVMKVMKRRARLGLLVPLATLATLATHAQSAEACSGEPYSPLVALDQADTVVLVHVEPNTSKDPKLAHTFTLTIAEVLRGSVKDAKTPLTVPLDVGMCHNALVEGQNYVVPLIKGRPAFPANFAYSTAQSLQLALAKAKTPRAKAAALVAMAQAVKAEATPTRASMIEYVRSAPKVIKTLSRKDAKVLLAYLTAVNPLEQLNPSPGWDIALRKAAGLKAAVVTKPA